MFSEPDEEALLTSFLDVSDNRSIRMQLLMVASSTAIKVRRWLFSLLERYCRLDMGWGKAFTDVQTLFFNITPMWVICFPLIGCLHGTEPDVEFVETDFFEKEKCVS